MKLTSKIALALVATTTAAIVAPLAATANPVTGSTAAAVSIKFGKYGNGNFSITPGSNANGGGTNVQELSAAVATGETDAKAKSSSSRMGTSADAIGYSAPVTLSYETYNSRTSMQTALDASSTAEFKGQAAIDFAANSKTSASTATAANSQYSQITKGRKVTSINSEAAAYAEAKAASEASTKLTASAQASALETAARKESASGSTSSVGTKYQYTGSSAGLQFLPAVVK
jgi:hypothetical protein